MKIAVISDIHDHVWNLQAALKSIQEAEMLICLGDLCSPFIVGLLGSGFAGRPIYLLFGNNDGDTFRITRNAANFPDIEICAEFLEIEQDGRKLAAVHYDNIARAMSEGGRYDAVFYGHNHRFDIHKTGKTLMVNPGALMGWSPLNQEGERDIPATFAIYDTETNQAAGYQVSGGSSSEKLILPYQGS